jgi:hypothetical protein
LRIATGIELRQDPGLDEDLDERGAKFEASARFDCKPGRFDRRRGVACGVAAATDERPDALFSAIR